MTKVDELRFGSRISVARFNEDGKRLFVLTDDQDAYILDTSGSTENAVTQLR